MSGREIGWMWRQAEEIRKEMATWPRWMRLAAQFEPRPIEDEPSPVKPAEGGRR